eukprot:2613222-Pyramimonas_sp.AAC.1
MQLLRTTKTQAGFDQTCRHTAAMPERHHKPNNHKMMAGSPAKTRELLEAAPVEEFYTVPTHMIPANSALATVAGEQPGHLPTWGNPRSVNTAATYHGALYFKDDDDSNKLDSGKHGH